MIVSAPERTILDALVISPDLPAIQARAQVVLLAAEGRDDNSIASELSMRRKDVLHWRKRFEAHGIRGLWDPPGPGPKKRVSPEKERALLWDVLYDATFRSWSTRLLAQKHGLTLPAVYRIFAKHGIVRNKLCLVDIKQLKIFPDPLFGVTVWGIAGLYYGMSGVLALTCTRQPFSELCFSTTQGSAVQAADGFINVLRKLAEIHRYFLTSAGFKRGLRLEDKFLDWLNAIEAGRVSTLKVHLLADWARQGTPQVQQWLAEHPDYQIYYPPFAVQPWIQLVQRSFAIITALPVQAHLVKDLNQATSNLAAVLDPTWFPILLFKEYGGGKQPS